MKIIFSQTLFVINILLNKPSLKYNNEATLKARVKIFFAMSVLGVECKCDVPMLMSYID